MGRCDSKEARLSACIHRTKLILKSFFAIVNVKSIMKRFLELRKKSIPSLDETILLFTFWQVCVGASSAWRLSRWFKSCFHLHWHHVTQVKKKKIDFRKHLITSISCDKVSLSTFSAFCVPVCRKLASFDVIAQVFSYQYFLLYSKWF